MDVYLPLKSFVSLLFYCDWCDYIFSGGKKNSSKVFGKQGNTLSNGFIYVLDLIDLKVFIVSAFEWQKYMN